jgi:hypothetical protein
MGWSRNAYWDHGGDVKTYAVNGDRMNPTARRHRAVDHIAEHLAAIGVYYVVGVDGALLEDG